MDLSTVNSAVNDAAAGLPAGWTQFINNNIGTPGGQQAILGAAAQYGITDPATIASLVNQATGGNVTAAQVQAVAQPAAMQSMAAPTGVSQFTPTGVGSGATPIDLGTSSPTGVSQFTPTGVGSGATPIDLGTSLSSMAAPQFVASAAPGAVGTTYGQASTAQTQAAATANPELASALTSGTAAVNYDADTGTYNLINTQTGSPIAGNYQVQVGPNGTGINIPSGNGMIQVTAQTDNSGTIAPVTAANVQNVGVNQGAGGFAGGTGTIMAAAEPILAVTAPALVPYIAAYNAADATNKGNYGAALVNAAISYAGFNPDSPLVQAVSSGQTVNPNAPASNPTSGTPADTGTTLSNVGNVPPTDYSLQNQAPIASTVAPTVSTAGTTPVDYSLTSGLPPQTNAYSGNGLNVGVGQGVPSATNPLFDTSIVNPSTGLANGLGVQPSGSTNLASMGGGQGLTTATTVGTSTTPNAVLGGAGVTPTDTGGLPINPATGQTLGTAASQITTGANIVPTTDTTVNPSYTLGNPATASTGTGLNVSQGTGVPSATNSLFNTTTVNPATGLTNGLGLQPSGSTNLASMGGGQGITAAANTGASGTPTGVVGADGVTPYGTGGLPVNTLTGQTLGQAVTNVNTGVTTPSSAILNGTGNVVGTVPGGTSTSTTIPAAAATGAATGAAATGAAAAGTGLTTGQAIALGLPAAAATLGTLGTNSAIANAASNQAAAGQSAQNTLLNLYNQQLGFQAPYQTAGNQAATTLSSAPAQSYLTNQFNNQDLNAQLAPNYAFQLQQGLGQAQNAANVGGGLLSGNTLQGLNTYAQNYAQGAYQNAFNNYQTQRQNIYQNLAGQAGIGQTANQQLSSLGGTLANTYGNITTGLAASAAGAQTAQAVNNANLLSNLANTATVAALA
jgi:hypothetical protein